MLLLLFSLINEKGFAQDFTPSIDSAFAKLQTRPPMEKLYLQLDKSTYNSGGTIWFKGYLLTATGHLPLAWSKFIYVELYNSSDSVVYRKKIKEQDGVFSGNIKLETEIPRGKYTIRAYSSWMLNAGLDFVFQKTIHISNFQNDNFESQIEYKNEENGKITATISFFDKQGTPLEKTRINCSIRLDDEKLETLDRTTDSEGKIQFNFIKKEENPQNQFIEVVFEKSDKSYRNRFFIPSSDENDFDIQFFPEGGELIAGCENQIAFKAIDQTGYSTEISGFIMADEKDTITRFESRHRGMGAFFLSPEKDKKYTATVTSSAGVSKTFSLPEISDKNAALSFVKNRSSIHLKIRTSDDSLKSNYSILAHSCENLLFSQKTEKQEYNIPTQNLPEGIVNFVLLDENKNPVSSRMVFIKKPNPVSVAVLIDKDNYKKREEVSLSIILQKRDTMVRASNFSIAVTDDQVVQTDALSDNIFSSLLLTSDLKGFVEDPAFYFQDNADSTNQFLDFLMLTQGWQRFNLENVLQENLPKPDHFLERGQTISGHYEKRFLSKRGPTEITALSFQPLISASTQTNDDGYFIFNELDFPDSTNFSIQSQRYSSIKQEPAGVITLHKDTFPPFSNSEFHREKTNLLYGEFLEKAKERMYYEGDGRMILLDEFVVTGEDKSKNYRVEYGISSNIIDEAEIAKKFPVSQTAEFIVKTLPGVSFQNDQVFIRGNRVPAEIMVDRMLTELNSLTLIRSEDIASLVIIKGAGAAVYSQNGGMGGVILINLKEGGSFESKIQGIEEYNPLGYQKTIEFYVPKYEVDSVRNSKDPDMRSTIYWNPSVKIDKRGIAKLNFYTADPNTTYTYILEGVTSLGEICRFVGKMKRNEQ